LIQTLRRKIPIGAHHSGSSATSGRSPRRPSARVESRAASTFDGRIACHGPRRTRTRLARSIARLIAATNPRILPSFEVGCLLGPGRRLQRAVDPLPGDRIVQRIVFAIGTDVALASSGRLVEDKLHRPPAMRARLPVRMQQRHLTSPRRGQRNVTCRAGTSTGLDASPASY
jgi:hypothetical protein